MTVDTHEDNPQAAIDSFLFYDRIFDLLHLAILYPLWPFYAVAIARRSPSNSHRRRAIWTIFGSCTMLAGTGISIVVSGLSLWWSLTLIHIYLILGAVCRMCCGIPRLEIEG